MSCTGLVRLTMTCELTCGKSFFILSPFRLPLALSGGPDESAAERLDGDFDSSSGVSLAGLGGQACVC